MCVCILFQWLNKDKWEVSLSSLLSYFVIVVKWWLFALTVDECSCISHAGCNWCITNAASGGFWVNGWSLNRAGFFLCPPRTDLWLIKHGEQLLRWWMMRCMDFLPLIPAPRFLSCFSVWCTSELHFCKVLFLAKHNMNKTVLIFMVKW